MNILIIGDSWGVPNYFGSPGIDKEYHTEYLLKELGYNVYNCSANGSGNYNTIQRAIDFLNYQPIAHPAIRHPYNYEITLEEQNVKIDWVVWFHTEWWRDFDSSNLTLADAENIACKKQYEAFAKLSAKLNCNIAIIGGQHPVNKMIYNFVEPNFIIEDWKTKILNTNLPFPYLLSRTEEVLPKVIDDTRIKLKCVENTALVYEIMKHNSDLFPDGGHPGIKPHADLVETLAKVFRGEVAQTVRAMDS
jgi:hypothetical protein